MEIQEINTALAPMSPKVMESAIIYEANIRQYSAEGTFEAFTRDIPQLKELGVNIIWLMPVYPISETRRKATGDLMVEDIEDPEERKKYLGSYYAISDYLGINPEFGTLDDFRALVKTAHDNGMYVILDWVANHTGWDHIWIKEHPDYYTKNAAGEITDPLQGDGTPWGWSDVADLNYDNAEMREAMIQAMMYWLKEEGIDGFRCDVAATVPTWFWKEAIGRLRAEKPIFMLAEAWEPELMEGELFDMGYGWDGHHLMNDIAKGHKNAWDWNNYMNDRFNKYGDDDILMNFLTNHDENSWNGTILERMGDAREALLALAYTMPGMPLIYSGQEYDMDHRLKFFEKDSINKTRGKMWPLMAKLARLKQETKALDGGKMAASYQRIDTSVGDFILSFKRTQDEAELIYVANMRSEATNFTLDLQGTYTDYMSGEVLQLDGQTNLEFTSWEYRILRPVN